MKSNQGTRDRLFKMQITSRKVVTNGPVCLQNINFAVACNSKCHVGFFFFSVGHHEVSHAGGGEEGVPGCRHRLEARRLNEKKTIYF